uniref:SUMO-activating enzyme subunit n=1 Tax=Strongyloides stercoralis TaxID=6248 RepID=A0A0K0EHP1_STRER
MSWYDENFINDLSKPILVVGAGGIGCELLKSLALAGFSNIEVFDLDTIDVSNLNRQFLFRKEHVGKPKAEIAAKAILKRFPSISVKYYYDSIMSEKYGFQFFKKFAVIFNALDNFAARNFVNRMCLAAEIPLIDAGTSGYIGSCRPIIPFKTECFECMGQNNGKEKTYPGCTIRNTPSEPIHCIVWAKYLFNQLFSEYDEHEDVTPNQKIVSNVTENEEEKDTRKDVLNNKQSIENLRMFAERISFSPSQIFNKIFYEGPSKLLEHSHLWEKRPMPKPLLWEMLIDDIQDSQLINEFDEENFDQHKLLTVKENVIVFIKCLKKLREMALEKEKSGQYLYWDKDEQNSMNFVSACANIRAHVFGISQTKPFEIKSMAGKIITAIASTNAIIAACAMNEGVKLLRGMNNNLRVSYLVEEPYHKGDLITSCEPFGPSEECKACSKVKRCHYKVNLNQMTVISLRDEILKKDMSLTSPSVACNKTGKIIVCDENSIHEDIMRKTLKDVGITSGSFLDIDDFFQQFNLVLCLHHSDELGDVEFEDITASYGENSKVSLGKRIAPNNIDEVDNDAKRLRVN